MKPMLKKVLVRRRTVALAVAAAALTVTTVVREHRTFAAPYPDLHASRDPAVIERGRYLVRGAAHCADCHGAPEQRAALEAGAGRPALRGYEFRLPVGVFRVPNITPDAETGTGRYSDPELARMLRHGVRPDGRMVLPFMPFANLSDDDLDGGASRTYARSRRSGTRSRRTAERARTPVGARVHDAQGSDAAIVKSVPSEPTVENGRYLANSVGNCVACHSSVDMRTGAIIGTPFGGWRSPRSGRGARQEVRSPNLTPHPRWGWIASSPEEVFVARIHMGKQREGSPMPWHGIRRMARRRSRGHLPLPPHPAPGGGGPESVAESSVESSAVSCRSAPAGRSGSPSPPSQGGADQVGREETRPGHRNRGAAGKRGRLQQRRGELPRRRPPLRRGGARGRWNTAAGPCADLFAPETVGRYDVR